MYSWKAFTDNKKSRRAPFRLDCSRFPCGLHFGYVATSPVRVTFKPTIGKLQLLAESGMSRADQVAVQGDEKDATLSNLSELQLCRVHLPRVEHAFRIVRSM